MKKVFLPLVLVLCASGAFGVGDQAYLGMFAETSVMKIPGMPAVPELPPGIDMEKMGKVPGMEQMMSMGAPKRQFTIRLWSPGLAPPSASAYVTPPEGLKQGDRLDLEIYRPEAVKTEGPTEGKEAKPTPSEMEFTIKYYWGSSETVKPGQPKIIKFGSLTSEQKRTMGDAGKRSGAGESYFYKPDWTTAYWPTSKQPGRIAKDASLVGTFSLATNYTGKVTIDCPTNVDFLAPIEMTSPALDQQINLDEAIKFVWKAIPNLLGSHAMITGFEGRNTMIIWLSSEVWREDVMSVDWGFLQMAEVRQYVQDTIMMKGDRTDVSVPAGIFEKCDMANFRMTGYGPGVARDKTQPIPRIQTKTTLNIVLGAKGMTGD